MNPPPPFWHLRGPERQAAKAKWCKFHDERRANPSLIFADLLHKYQLEAPGVEVAFDGDRLRLTCNGRSEIVPRDPTHGVLKLILNYLTRPLSACGGIESENLMREETEYDRTSEGQ